MFEKGRYFGAGETDETEKRPIPAPNYALMLEASALLKRAGFRHGGKPRGNVDKHAMSARKAPTRKPEPTFKLIQASQENERRFNGTCQSPGFAKATPGKPYTFKPATYDSILETVKENDTNDRRNGWKLTR